jgi:hypothetical protein
MSHPFENGGFTLQRGAQQRLELIDAQGRRHVGVEPVRCFPISHPEQWIAICDDQGHELACVRELRLLPPEVQQILEEELAASEFVPIVERIVHVEEDSDCCRWEIETDRGPIRFKSGDENPVSRLDPQRAVIVDTSGIRYLIPSVDKLDKSSRRMLEQYW